jgi:hypothetical protein
LELFEVYFSITVYVETSKNANKFVLGGNVACTSQEAFEIVLVKIPIGPIIDGVECLFKCEIV